jgi:hypothetical protein
MRVVLVTPLAFILGCATTTKGKIFSSMAAGASVGALYGSSRPEAKAQNAMLWSAVGAATSGAIALLINDPDKETESLKAETSRLREELSLLETPKIEKQTNGLFGSKVPEKYRSLINPGEWRVSRIDQWIEDDENRLIHQDLIMELTPPSLIPVSKPTQSKQESKK